MSIKSDELLATFQEAPCIFMILCVCVFVDYDRTQYKLKPVQKFRVKSINSNVNCLHKMKLILLICSISVIFTIIDGSISEDQSDDGNPGDALYLTKYIESGDIETVSF